MKKAAAAREPDFAVLLAAADGALLEHLLARRFDAKARAAVLASYRGIAALAGARGRWSATLENLELLAARYASARSRPAKSIGAELAQCASELRRIVTEQYS